MKYCQKCGKELVDEAVICTNCGCSVPTPIKSTVDDAPNIGFAVLGFFIPLAGLILYLVNKDATPLRAKSAGKGALIGFCVNIGVSILYTVLMVVGMLVGLSA